MPNMYADNLLTRFDSCMMDEAQFRLIAGCLAEVNWRSADIVVEVGTYHGQTSAFIALCLRELGQHSIPVIGIDPFERLGEIPEDHEARGIARGQYAGYWAEIDKYGVADQCFPIPTWSRQAARVIPPDVAFLLIDGDHSYDGCKLDMAIYLPKLRVGGIAVIDDYHAKRFPGVVKAVDEWLGAGPAPRFTVETIGQSVVVRRNE